MWTALLLLLIAPGLPAEGAEGRHQGLLLTHLGLPAEGAEGAHQGLLLTHRPLPTEGSDQTVPGQDADPELQELGERAREQEAALRELLASYRRVDGLRNVRIHMEGRVVELEGTALSAEARDRAAELAERITGAVHVVNRIEVERTLAGRMAPAMERFQDKGTAFIQYLPVLSVGLLLLLLTVLAAVAVGRPRMPYQRITGNVFAQNVLRQAARTVVVLAGVLLTLELLGATALVGAVLGTAGLFGLAIGFAFRDIAENYLAGILLSLRQPFAPMDHVELSGHEGKVVRLTGRETILMTLDGNHVRIPNTLVFKGILTNFTRNPRRRFQIQVGIAPDEDVGRALRIGKEAILGVPGVLENPRVVGRAVELAASSVELRFMGWVDQAGADFPKVRSEALRCLKETFEDEGIRTPPPEYGVRILGGDDGEADHREDGTEEAEPRITSPGEAGPPPGQAVGTDGGPGSGREPTPRPAPPPRPEREPDPESPDIRPDTTIEEQIAEDLATSKEENLLEGSDSAAPRK